MESRGLTPVRITAYAAAVIAIILVFATLITLAEIAIPFTAAAVIGTTLGPLVDRARKLGISPTVCALIAVLLLFALLTLAVTFLSGPISAWIARLPEAGPLLRDKLSLLNRPLAAWAQLERTLKSSSRAATVELSTSPATVITYLMSIASPAIGEILIFIASLFFFIAGRQQLKTRLTLAFMHREDRLTVLRLMGDIEHRLAGYLLITSAINICLGVTAGLVFWIIGLPDPLLWGAGATLLNFIPYAGPLVMTGILVVTGLLAFPDLASALVPVSAYLIIVFVESHFVTPNLLGWRLDLSPFMVFAAVVFWAWLWGPVGAFLAIPILIMALVIHDHFFSFEHQPELPG